MYNNIIILKNGSLCDYVQDESHLYSCGKYDCSYIVLNDDSIICAGNSPFEGELKSKETAIQGLKKLKIKNYYTDEAIKLIEQDINQLIEKINKGE